MALVLPTQAVSQLKMLLSISIILLTGTAQAQIRYGVKAGVNFSTLKFSDDYAKKSSLIGYHAGVLMDVKISDKFVFQPEVLFSTQGVKRKVEVRQNAEDQFHSATLKTKINYLNLDLMMKYYVIKKLDLEAGARIGLMLSAWNVLEVYRTELNDVQPIDYGVNLGAGYDFTDHISVGVRYYYGLFNISKYSHDENVGNRVFGVSGVYKF